MACANRCAQAVYNNAIQPYVATGTALNILGTKATSAGCCVETTTGGFVVRDSGLYRFSFDITSIPTAAGVQIVQLFKDNIPLPCAITTDNVLATDGTITQHVEAVLMVGTCCNIRPAITLQISGVTGSVTHLAGSAIKLG